MKISNLAWALPVCAVTTSALVIPSVATDAIAGSIANPDISESINSSLSELDAEYQKLEVLKQNLFELHHKVLRQERDILSLINKDYSACSGITCYFQTAIRKAPAYVDLIKTHFRHHPKNSTDLDCPWTKKAKSSEELLGDSTAEGHDDQQHSAFDFNSGGFESESESNFDFNAGAEEQPPFSFNEGDHEVDENDPFSFNAEGTPPFEFGRPIPEDVTPFDHGKSPFDFNVPDQPPHPEYNPNKPNLEPPADKPYGHPGPHRPFHMPNPAPPHRHYKLILTSAGLTVSFLILIILFKAVRVYLSNPRVQADRAARREECRTRREYRRAACQHRFRQCLSRFRRRASSGTDDYEEKRAMLQHQRSNSDSDVGHHVVAADISSLRRAHEIVERLMRAEEGRQPSYTPSVEPSNQPSSSSRSVRSLQTTRTMTTLPPYAPPPPRYSLELSRDMEVVDGFRYTPTQSDATPSSTEVASSASSFILNDEDLCTESSVVDCRSRMSMETDSVSPSLAEDADGRKQSLELAGDRYRGRFD